MKTKGIGYKAGLALMIFVILFTALLYIGLQATTARVQPMNSEPINGYFIDVNGDGQLDYVVSSEVIINKGALNLALTP
jgi:hypothetical protein